MLSPKYYDIKNPPITDRRVFCLIKKASLRKGVETGNIHTGN